MNHFKFFWSRDRLPPITHENYINALPRSLKQGLIVHYLFDDIFYSFRLFFQPQTYKETKLLQDMSFGLKPRKFLG